MQITKEKRLTHTSHAKEIVNKMTLEEKVSLMSGDVTLQMMMTSKQSGGHYNHIPYCAGGNEQLGVPSVRFCDGPRGVVCGQGKATCFPVPMLRGATFDIGLEEKIGRAIACEVRAFGGNFFGGVCINLPYNPGWGRSQEVYGEDSFALGALGSALVRGVQSEGVIACLKHFAFNSMENSRFKVSVDCARRTEREVYLPHFKDCIDAGAAAVMTAYNLYRGVHCGHSDYLLRKVLKEEWDFDGFAISDFFWGISDTVEAANGGMDIEMCDTNQFGNKLVDAVKNGLVEEEHIDEAAVRILRTVLAFEQAYEQSGNNYGDETLGCKDHIELSLRAAQEGITLIKNDHAVLPLAKGLKKIVLFGKLAARPNIGDRGSSRVYPEYVVSPLEGIVKTMPQAEVVFYDGDDLNHAKQMAEEADAVIFVVGMDHKDEGEYISSEQSTNYIGSKGGDRSTLGLHQNEIDLINTVGPINKNSIAVLIGGNTITVSEWEKNVSSMLMAYYPGQEGGTALAQVLFGDINPSGKLPFVLPVNESDLPQVKWDTTNQYYHYYHGYALLDKKGIKPFRPYGFGMSYTKFEISNSKFSLEGGHLVAAATIKNTGSIAGAEVLQMYVGFENSKLDRPVKVLRGFERVQLCPGESKEVTIYCPVEKIYYYNTEKSCFELEHMEYEVYIGTSSASEDLLQGIIDL